jgi:hypothetical protein
MGTGTGVNIGDIVRWEGRRYYLRGYTAASSGGNGIAALSLILLGTGAVLRYSAWRIRKAVQLQERADQSNRSR